MPDNYIVDLLNKGGGSQVEIGTVTTDLGKNKYRVSIRGNPIVAYAATDVTIKKGIPAVVTLTQNGWYIMGQPKNILATGATEVVVTG